MKRNTIAIPYVLTLYLFWPLHRRIPVKFQWLLEQFQALWARDETRSLQ